MPELPEVETIKLGLQRKIVGLTIKNVEIRSPKTFIGDHKKVVGQKVLNVWRRAKILGIDLDRNLTLLFHLKMTGQLVLVHSAKCKVQSRKRLSTKHYSLNTFVGGHPTPDMQYQMPNSHTRVIFSFSDGSHLYFNDQRRFGWVKIVQSEKCKVQSEEVLGKLGPEPLEEGFTWQILKTNLLLSKKGRINHKSQPVKVAIMDQEVVAGVGNIYASEACFNAKLDPRKKVKDLTDQEFKKLHQGIIKSLKEGIKHGGSTRAHFVNAEGEKGYFLDYANVYGKEGEKCRGCSGVVKKITLGGRGTYFCENCQK